LVHHTRRLERWPSSDHDFKALFSPRKYRNPDGSTIEDPDPNWEILPEREAELKNMGATPIREVIKTLISIPSQRPEVAAKEVLQAIKQAGRYWPDEQGSTVPADPAS